MLLSLSVSLIYFTISINHIIVRHSGTVRLDCLNNSIGCFLYAMHIIKFYFKQIYNEFRLHSVLLILAIINIYVFYQIQYMDIEQQHPKHEGSQFYRYMDSNLYQSEIKSTRRFKRFRNVGKPSKRTSKICKP